MEQTVKINLIDDNGDMISYWGIKGQPLQEIIESAGINLSPQPNTDYLNKIKVEGDVSPLTSFEREKIRPAELKEGIRLAEHCFSAGEASVYLGKNYQSSLAVLYQELQTRGIMNHGWQNKKIFIPGRHIELPIPLYDRISQVMGDYKFELTSYNLNELSAIDRTGRPALELNAVIQEKNRRVVYIGRQEEPIYGVIIQVGSNYLWTALADLQSGRLVNVIYNNNLYKFMAQDIKTLISYCRHNQAGNEILRQLLVNQLNKMIQGLLASHNLISDNVYRVIIMGNTFMLHWFAGFNVTWSGERPFTGIFSKEMRMAGSKSELTVNPAAELIILPLPGDIYGSDILVGILALNTTADNYLYLYWEDELNLILKTSDYTAISSIPMTDDRQENGYPPDLIENFLLRFELKLSDLDAIFLGSNYSQYLSIDQILSSGLLPADYRDKIRNVGNVALHGALKLLLNDTDIVKTSYIKERMKIIPS